MAFDREGLAAFRIGVSRKLIQRVFHVSRHYRFLEGDQTQLGDYDVLADLGPAYEALPPSDNHFHWSKTPSRKQVYRLRGAVLDLGTGYIYDSRRLLIGDFISWAIPQAESDRPALPLKARPLDYPGDVLYLGVQGYYHWLLEDFPAYLQARSTVTGATTLVRRRSPQYVLDALRLAGAVISEAPVVATVPQLVFASKGVALVPSRVDVATLREFATGLALPPGGPDKIYISRRDSGRMPVNEDAVEALVLSLGFRIVSLTGTPLEQQIQLFRNAKHVVGTHGAGLANLAWCAPNAGVVVVELRAENQPRSFKWLAEAGDLEYREVATSHPEAWKVDLVALRQALGD